VPSTALCTLNLSPFAPLNSSANKYTFTNTSGFGPVLEPLVMWKKSRLWSMGNLLVLYT
jgi:hypothetical protein